jgi:BTB/POZ domain
MAILEELEQRIISLNVGGTCVTTTAATLAAVEGSFLWKLVFIQPAQPSQRTQAGDFFIDRDGKVTAHCLTGCKAPNLLYPCLSTIRLCHPSMQVGCAPGT